MQRFHTTAQFPIYGDVEQLPMISLETTTAAPNGAVGTIVSAPGPGQGRGVEMTKGAGAGPGGLQPPMHMSESAPLMMGHAQQSDQRRGSPIPGPMLM